MKMIVLIEFSMYSKMNLSLKPAQRKASAAPDSATEIDEVKQS
jgi:hypothetical protein